MLYCPFASEDSSPEGSEIALMQLLFHDFAKMIFCQLSVLGFFVNKLCCPHLLGQVVVQLIGHGDSLMICYDAVLKGAHGLCGAADVGFHGAQSSAVVLPVAGQLLEDQSLLICFSLQGIDPHGAGENRHVSTLFSFNNIGIFWFAINRHVC